GLCVHEGPGLSGLPEVCGCRRNEAELADSESTASCSDTEKVRLGEEGECIGERTVHALEPRKGTPLRVGKNFDTPPLEGLLRSASSALGLPLEMTRLTKCRALCG